MLHISSLIRVKIQMNEVRLSSRPFIATDFETVYAKMYLPCRLQFPPCMLL